MILLIFLAIWGATMAWGSWADAHGYGMDAVIGPAAIAMLLVIGQVMLIIGGWLFGSRTVKPPMVPPGQKVRRIILEEVVYEEK